MIQLARFLPKPIAFVLAGGASYGSVQVGQLRALAETDIVPDLVVGTSVGALNGAVVAENPETAPRRLSEVWSGMTREKIFGKTLDMALNMASRHSAVSENTGLRSVIEGLLTSRDFSDLLLPYTAMATDFDTGEPVPIGQGDLVEALLASAAIPVVFPRVKRDGRDLVDGGLVANVPIGAAAAQGAQSIVVLDCGFTVVAPQRDNSYASMLMRTVAIMAAQQVRKDLDSLKRQTVLYLPGPWPIHGRPDEFDQSEELAAASYDLSLEWLSGLQIKGSGRYGSAPADALRKAGPADSTAAEDSAGASETGQDADSIDGSKSVAVGVGAAAVKAAGEVARTAVAATVKSAEVISDAASSLTAKDEKTGEAEEPKAP